MSSVILKLRAELADLNMKIKQHKAVNSPNTRILHDFVMNQFYIMPHDLRALSLMLAKAKSQAEIDFFKSLVDGDYAAFNALTALARELDVKFDLAHVSPKAVGYTHYLSWLALHGNSGEAAIALAVNLPVWGANLEKLGGWAKKVGLKQTGIFELFSGSEGKMDESAEAIAEPYLDWDRYRFIARAVQQYELDFWDAIAIASAT